MLELNLKRPKTLLYLQLLLLGKLILAKHFDVLLILLISVHIDGI